MAKDLQGSSKLAGLFVAPGTNTNANADWGL
jgi:hypothetical protein